MSAVPRLDAARPRRRAERPATALPHDGTAHALLGWVVALTALLAAMGWLYLLRRTAALDIGPRLPGALPLQQLNGDADQPLARVLLAWLPAGLAAGGTLAALTRLSWGARTLAVLVLAVLVLTGSGAISDAVALNEPVRAHLTAQLAQAGWWVELGCVVLGALLVRAGPRSRRCSPRLPRR